MATERVHQQGSIASLRKHIPIRKLSARHTTKPSWGMPDFEMLKPSGNSTSIVVAVTEARPSNDAIPEVPEPESPETQKPEPRARPLPPPLTVPAKAHVRHEPKISSPDASPVSPSPPPSRAVSAADVPLPQSSTNTPNVDGKSSQVEEPEQTPVMRSMFPSYNPTVPLAKQHYAPNIDTIPAPSFARRFSSNNPYIQQRNRSQTDFGTPAVATEGPRESPLRRSESMKRGNAISTPEELLELWSIANGQDYEQASESYTLELSWYGLRFPCSLELLLNLFLARI